MVEEKIKNGNEVELTEAESELYDRQIRLWGLESQKRLRTAKILISGLGGVGAEITKNIILSGVNLVKLRDDKLVTEEDICSQFLVSRESIGENRAEASVERAQALNPMVELSTDIEPLSGKDKNFFKQFDVVVVCGETTSELLRANDICREEGIKFFSCDVWGNFGYYFADLQTHKFVINEFMYKVISKPNQERKTEKITVPITKELVYPSLSAVLDLDVNDPRFIHMQNKKKREEPGFCFLRVLQHFRDEYNRDPDYKSRDADIQKLVRISNKLVKSTNLPNEAFETTFAQISPAAAIVGGVVAQEIIKVVTRLEEPHRNVFLFDPVNCCGSIETIGVN